MGMQGLTMVLWLFWGSVVVLTSWNIDGLVTRPGVGIEDLTVVAKHQSRQPLAGGRGHADVMFGTV